MKAQDAPRTSALRMAKATLKNREIDRKAPLDDAEATSVLRSLARQREESVKQFRAAGREELAAKEEAELAVIRAYLPEEASDEEITAAVEATVAQLGASSPKDVGRVMKPVIEALKAAGRPADGRRVNEAVRRRLGG